MNASIRAGQCLGRCHAAKGQSTLSVAALDAALALAETGRCLLSQLITVRERAAVGMAAADGAGAVHWDENKGRQRLAEVLGRMQMAEAEREALAAALLSLSPSA